MGNRDSADQLVTDWIRIRPDLDFEPMALYARLNRFVAVSGRSIEELFQANGISTGEFDVLSALRRSGEPFVMTPSNLARAVMLTRAGMTSRLDRLEAMTLIERRRDLSDRRSEPVALTPAGLDLVDRLIGAHIDNEATLFAGLTPVHRKQLDALLRRLLRACDESDRPSDPEVRPRGARR